MISLVPDPALPLRRVVRIRNRQLGNGYIVPKQGRIIIGSSAEEKGLDIRNTAGRTMDNLRRAYAAVPGLYELTIQETWAGLRPSSIDRLPVVATLDNRQYFLNGLHRNGILMGPFIGHHTAAWIRTGRMPDALQPFSIQRFDTAQPHL